MARFFSVSWILCVTNVVTQCPTLQMTWLDSLANLHMAEENWEEAAQCYTYRAAMELAMLLARMPQKVV